MLASVVQPAAIDDALRTTLLDTARTPVSQTLGKPVLFKVDHLRRDGDWAFLLAEMADRAGAPIDYAGTSKQEAAKQGFVSRRYAALMRRQNGHWSVVAHAIGPTDVAWADWAKRYGAPQSLF